MSIVSQICAEEANKIRKQWIVKLMEAFRKQDWELIQGVIKEMHDFHFSE